MEVKDLLIFNKEGNLMNLKYDENTDILNGKIFFDKNSTDTYKTQAFYLFEKIQGSSNLFDSVTLDRFQLFNTEGFEIIPSNGLTNFIINDIKKSNDNANFYTKQIYITDIHLVAKQQQYLYFTGLESFDSTYYDNFISGEIQLHQILKVENNRILINIGQDNSNAIPSFSYSINKKINFVNVIECTEVSELQNETNFDTLIYKNKKLSLLTNIKNNINDGLYTVFESSFYKNKYFYDIPSSIILTPVVNDKIKLDITLLTDRILFYDGTVNFVASSNYIEFSAYIPKFLKVGQQIVAYDDTFSLLVNNQQTLTITSIDSITNRIYVSNTLSNQNTVTKFYLATNVFSIEQDIVLDNNNLYSVPVTYQSIVNEYKTYLNNLGIDLEYLESTDALKISGLSTSLYFSVDMYYTTNNITSQLSLTLDNFFVYPLTVNENLIEKQKIEKNSSIYNKKIIINTLDNFGFNLLINNKLYDVDSDVTITDTLNDQYNLYNIELSDKGIIVTQSTTNITNDTLTFTTVYPNIPLFIEHKLGDFTNYLIPYKTFVFNDTFIINNIKTQLLIIINGRNFSVPFDTDDVTTVTNQKTTYTNLLKNEFNLDITNDLFFSNTNAIQFNTPDFEKTFDISYNIGYIPKSGDFSVLEIDSFFQNSITGTVLSGNEINITPGTYNFYNYFSVGQKISINESNYNLQNTSYNIIGLTDSKINLSYQGAFFNDSNNINIVASDFITYPKNGISVLNEPTKLKWSQKQTQNDNFFIYDFSGQHIINYTGPIPLCDTDGSVELKLNKFYNINPIYNNDPTKQRTVFDKLIFDIPFIDSTVTEIEPEPMQVFIGYNSKQEGTNKARLYLEQKENISFTLQSNTNTDDLQVFNNDTVELQNLTTQIDLNILGFKKGQIISFSFDDDNSDNRKIATLNNAGKKFKIKNVVNNKITITTLFENETSIKTVAKTTFPYYDIDGITELTENRALTITMKVVDKIIAYFDIYGESEGEDERHDINLNNRNLNILKMQDYFIFKEVDIKEKGIDQIILNRKRKELLEIYPEMFNNIASYKSVIQAINFFGYNDLSFTEFYQNINPESNKFGQLYNIDLNNIFDKVIKGQEYSNMGLNNSKDNNYRKTNLYALNYKITDTKGNFINAYSLEEVRYKLTALKNWLTENILPFGTKITDINGKYNMDTDITLKHESYKVQTFKIEEYSKPVDFSISGYNIPVTTGSDIFNINVKFDINESIDWCDFNIRTFNIQVQDRNNTYLPNVKVYQNNKIQKSVTTTAVPIEEEPGFSQFWETSVLDTIEIVQNIKGYKYDLTNEFFNINKTLDPHFVIDVFYHSGYGNVYLNTKYFSVSTEILNNL